VFKGPKKDGKVKRLYYVYGTSLSAKDEGIKQEPYRPVGKGYNWPESYRKANNLYYELTFGDQGQTFFHIDTDTLQSKNNAHTRNSFSIYKPVVNLSHYYLHELLKFFRVIFLLGENVIF